MKRIFIEKITSIYEGSFPFTILFCKVNVAIDKNGKIIIQKYSWVLFTKKKKNNLKDETILSGITWEYIGIN